VIEKLKITVLSDNNSSNPEYKSEHGLSLLIEDHGKKYLFDTGASDLFCKNTNKLNIDCKDFTKVIISHGHYDHTGGLTQIKNKDIYIHPDIFKPKLKIEDKDSYKYIGVPQNKEFYETNNQLNFINVSGIFDFTTDIKLITGFKKNNDKKAYFFIEQDNEYITDTFNDELIMTINTPKGLIIITGCSHSGIINIIERALEVHNTTKIYALFGGFHLSKLEESDISTIADKLNNYKIENIGISHCTGDKLTKYLTCNNIIDFRAGATFSTKGSISK